jgi:hypothetical protein
VVSVSGRAQDVVERQLPRPQEGQPRGAIVRVGRGIVALEDWYGNAPPINEELCVYF